MKITKDQAKKLGEKFKINFKIINFDEWIFGLNIELEHGKYFGKTTNITNNNLNLTAKIVIAHLLEFPNYYYYLKKMEERGEKYWKDKNKPNIFIL